MVSYMFNPQILIPMKNKLYLFSKERSFLISVFLVTFILVVASTSCKKDNILKQDDQNIGKSTLNNSSLVNLKSDSTAIYYGHEKFTRGTAAPVVIRKQIGSKDLLKFEENFTLFIQNGDGKNNLVSSAVIKIDGKEIFNPSNFSQKKVSLSKTLTGLTEFSVLEVELRGKPGGFIDLWIEGTLKCPACGNIVTDIDGNSYHTVQIGTQCWMVENLKTTKFNDGTTIPFAPIEGGYPPAYLPALYWYNNDSVSYVATYGALYNFYAVNTGKLCPTGWHVPTDAEWHTLALFLDASANYEAIESFVAGGKLKETGTTHWLSPNTGATNETGYTALPGGLCSAGLFFAEMNEVGYWWSSTEYISTGLSPMMPHPEPLSYNRVLDNLSGNLGRGTDNWISGLSVRCIKD